MRGVRRTGTPACTRTDTVIAAVAEACGFADQSHLTLTMRRHLGLTPGALRTDRAEAATSGDDGLPFDA
ncbi:AraC family transcriptional regulator [Streptomyces sp. NPDC015684]|uniref:AraC family transcriptional regulator n=1 Tax=Streptomyces sp. NPDC015684 TaxID=3364963 RepID=UPI0036F54F21